MWLADRPDMSRCDSYSIAPPHAGLVGTSRVSEPISISQRLRGMAAKACTSGKSTQKAFILRPYKKLAKLSLNLERLSCINCICMKLASRSAMESLSSANAGSNEAKGDSEAPVLALPL